MRLITPTCTLLFYDYPQIFIGSDAVGQHYVFMASDETETSVHFLSTPISTNRVYKLRTGKEDLRSVFAYPEIQEFYLVELSQTQENIELHQPIYTSCPEEELPDEGLVFNNWDMEVLDKSRELDTTIAYVSLSVAEAKESARISARTLSAFLAHYQSVLKNLSKTLMRGVNAVAPEDDAFTDIDVFDTSYGSFTVHVRGSEDSQNLLGDSETLSMAFDELNQFLAKASSPQKALDILKSYKGHTASSLLRLLKFMDENSCSLSHRWASPCMTKAFSAQASFTDVRALLNICRAQDDLSSVHVNLEGTFTKVDRIKGTWNLSSEDGKKSHGLLHEEVPNLLDGVTVSDKAKYRLYCQEIVTVDGTLKEIKTLYIKKLEAL